MTRVAAAAIGIAFACGAHGAPFADPTRPPRAVESSAAAGTPGGPRLESVLIGPDRRVAVISGQQVTLGSKFGGGEVVRITESEVLIRRAEGDESLQLFPQDGKRPAPRGKGK
jgi:MSHA biogenesis protein MshK